MDLRLFLFPQELLIAIREESEIDLSFDTDDCTYSPKSFQLKSCL